MPTTAPAAATRRSQESATSRPPPMACPLSAATVGYGYASSAAIAAAKGWATSFSASSAKVSSGMPPMSYPAENVRPAPVRSRQRASSEGTACAIASRIAWSRAFRLSGLLIVSRATCSTGSSSRSLPSASSCARSLVEDNERVTFVDRLALLAEDLGHGPGVLGLDRHVHLHRLEDHHRVPLVHLIADGDLDLPDGAGDVGLDIGQGTSSWASCPDRVRGRIAAPYDHARPTRRHRHRLQRGGSPPRHAGGGRSRVPRRLGSGCRRRLAR